jgi:putative endonuclease
LVIARSDARSDVAISGCASRVVPRDSRPMIYYVYILTNTRNSVLYVGMTRDLQERVRQHKAREVEGFTRRYRVDRLVCYEEYPTAYDAMAHEKQLKAGPRRKKMALIDDFNPKWRDLYHEIAGITP